MISFHFVSLTCWTQFGYFRTDEKDCCDFLSFCIFDLLNTIKQICGNLSKLLWFPFILYLWLVEHNATINYPALKVVVISFHFVSLTCWTQLPILDYALVFSCDFLSFCIFDLLNTINNPCKTVIVTLWFPFILYLWLVEHNKNC